MHAVVIWQQEEDKEEKEEDLNCVAQIANYDLLLVLQNLNGLNTALHNRCQIFLDNNMKRF